MAESVRPCQVPGCVALATKGPLCAAHRFAQEHPERLWTAENAARREFEQFLPGAWEQLRRLRPGVARFLIDIERVPLPMPALLDFQFHSPRATLLVAEDLAGELLPLTFSHEIDHFREQVRRFRHPGRRGLAERAEAAPEDERYAPWRQVDACRGRGDVRLSDSQLAALVKNAPRCERCGRQPGRLEWFYFMTPEDTWLCLQGVAGWMGVCGACREQVALFIDRMN